MILVVNGSTSKNRNTDTLTKEFCKLLEEQGKEYTLFNVYENRDNIRGCKNCGYCVKKDYCCIKDSCTEILRDLSKGVYDTIILASPIFFYGLSGEVKSILDRTYSVNKLDMNIGLILVSGSSFATSGADLIIKSILRSCEYCGMNWLGAFHKVTYDQIQPITEQDIHNLSKLITGSNSNSVFVD